MRLGLAALLVFSIAACGVKAEGQPNATSLARPTVNPSSLNSDETLEPATTDAGPGSPSEAKIGQSIRITCDGQDCMDVVVLKATTATRYKDAHYSDLDDKPKHKGDVFLAVQVRYTAIGAGADYNALDWGLYVNDEQVQDQAFVSNGPEPALIANDLPKGKKVTGWIVWEVPSKGRIVLSYEPGRNGSIFEVVLRGK